MLFLAIIIFRDYFENHIPTGHLSSFATEATISGELEQFCNRGNHPQGT